MQKEFETVQSTKLGRGGEGRGRAGQGREEGRERKERRGEEEFTQQLRFHKLSYL